MRKIRGETYFEEGSTIGKLVKQKICSESEGGKKCFIWKPIMINPFNPQIEKTMKEFSGNSQICAKISF
jgi:hypothetical protein